MWPHSSGHLLYSASQAKQFITQQQYREISMAPTQGRQEVHEVVCTLWEGWQEGERVDMREELDMQVGVKMSK